MSNVLEQMKRNAVPAGVMHSAAKGALPLPPAEMLEILVYLTQNPVFAQEAQMTLARWDAESAIPVVSDPAAPAEVLSYYWMDGNRRPSLMPALIENPAIPESLLMELAGEPRREVVRFLLESKRARSSRAVVEALGANPAVEPEQLRELKGESSPPEQAPTAPEQIEAQIEAAEAESDPEIAAAHQSWHQEHAQEIAAEEGKPFELVGEDEPTEAETMTEPESASETPPHAEAVTSSPAGEASAAMAARALGMQARAQGREEEGKKLTVLQKIARMNAAERVKTAFTGGRDERAILIRDGARVVQNAVLSSPKLTDPEVETFASAKNISENVIREIARSRKFMKNYNVGRNLVNNPKTPLDISLTLIKNLMVYDLKGLRFNKSVPETIRSVAAKLYKEKAGPARDAKRG